MLTRLELICLLVDLIHAHGDPRCWRENWIPWPDQEGARVLHERVRGVVDHPLIIEVRGENVLPYVLPSFSPSPRREVWEFHRGRATSSLRQLKRLVGRLLPDRAPVRVSHIESGEECNIVRLGDAVYVWPEEGVRAGDDLEPFRGWDEYKLA